jgi:hypothetical protein
MKCGTLVVEWLATWPFTFLASAKSSKVFDSFWGCVSKEANHSRNTINVNVKKYFVGNLLQGIMLSLPTHQIAAQ